MTDNSLTGLRSYQRLRRITLAVLLALVFFVLLFGQSIFPPETVVHEAIVMAGIVLIVIGIAGRNPLRPLITASVTAPQAPRAGASTLIGGGRPPPQGAAATFRQALICGAPSARKNAARRQVPRPNV